MALTWLAGVGIETDIIQWLESNGYLDAQGDLVDAKWQDVADVVAFIAGVQAILQKRGVTLPPKLLAILQTVEAIIPLVAPLIK